MKTKDIDHVISVTVQNHSGVLARIAGLFSARGYNIDSLAVSKTEHYNVSVMTIVVHGNDGVIEQVKKQLNKLIDVIKVVDHTNVSSIQRELIIIKVSSSATKRAEIYQLGDMFHAEVVDLSVKSISFSLMADPSKVDNFVELLKPYGIKNLMRTGRISLSKE